MIKTLLRYLVLAALLLSLPLCGHTQSFEKNYPQTLVVPADTFYISYSDENRKIPKYSGLRDTIDSGTDGAPGLSATIYYGKDSLRIPYENFPYWGVYYIPLQLPHSRKTFRLHFNGINGLFPADYINAHKGKITIEVPEVFELANIIWTLSPAGQRATDLNKEGPYYQKVLAYFKPYLNHPVFTKLDFPDSLFYNKYYDFRENSITYTFRGDQLVYEGPYYYVMGDDWDNYNSLFRQLLPLVEDFVKKTKFHEFYRQQQTYYNQQIARAGTLLPLKNMWDWLEKEFPGLQYHHYKVVFSPLIGGSHSTQRFSTYRAGWFREILMFICGPERYDRRTELNDKQREGLMSGIVFTEIDHNYVNPVTDDHYPTVDSIFSDRAFWAGSKTGWYDSPVSVFNEYMTHSVFCLWVADRFEKPVADYVITEREKLMVERRGFIRFREFNQALLRIRKANPGINTVKLYPLILEWCREAAMK